MIAYVVLVFDNSYECIACMYACMHVVMGLHSNQCLCILVFLSGTIRFEITMAVGNCHVVNDVVAIACADKGLDIHLNRPTKGFNRVMCANPCCCPS